MPRHFRHDRPHKRGTELTAVEQAHVLRAYCHRYTGEHVPAWARELRGDGRRYCVQFLTDRDWLENTLFQVTKTGKLDCGVTSCHSSPTWPYGVE